MVGRPPTHTSHTHTHTTHTQQTNIVFTFSDFYSPGTSVERRSATRHGEHHRNAGRPYAGHRDALAPRLLRVLTSSHFSAPCSIVRVRIDAEFPPPGPSLAMEHEKRGCTRTDVLHKKRYEYGSKSVLSIETPYCLLIFNSFRRMVNKIMERLNR